MDKAKITAKNGFRCAPEGHTIVTFPHGEIVTGQVATWALASGDASRMFDPRTETKVAGPDEVKAAPKRTRKVKK